jgi:hypothetical protein
MNPKRRYRMGISVLYIRKRSGLADEFGMNSSYDQRIIPFSSDLDSSESQSTALLIDDSL